VIKTIADRILHHKDNFTTKGNFRLRDDIRRTKHFRSELISTFEEKQVLHELVQDTLTDENNTGIQVYIGEEAPVQSMRDCSIVTATYELGDGMKGTIGIIGPKRMDYDKVIGTLKTLMNEFDTRYKK